MGSSHPAPRKVVATTGTAVVVSPKKLTADDVAAVVAGQGAAYTPYTDAIIKCRMDGKALRGFNDTQLEVKLRGSIGVADPVHMATLLFILPVLRSLTAPSSSSTTADADALNDTREQLDILMLAGNTLFQQNMLSAARAVYERTLVGYERTIGPDHASTIGLVNNLGVLAVAQRRPNDACTLFTRALAGREQLFGPSHALTLSTCQMLANLHLAQQRRDNALDLYIRCYHGFVALHGQEHTAAVTCLKSAETICRQHLHLSAALKKSGRLDEALSLCAQARDGYERCMGPDHASTLAAVTALAVLHEKRDHFDEAKAAYLLALQGTERTAGVNHIKALHLVCNLAHLHRNHGLLGDASEYFARALAGYEKAYGPKHAETANLRREMGMVTEHLVSQSQATDKTSVALPPSRKGSVTAVTSRKDS